MAEPAKQEDPWKEFPVSGGAAAGSPAADVNQWNEFPLANPSVGDKFGALVKGAGGGAVEHAYGVAGAITGGQIGTAVTPPPFTPIGTAAGAAIGYGAGLYAGRGVRKPIFGEVEDMPPNLRPYGVGGETFGASAVYGALPFMGYAAGTRLAPSAPAGQYLNRLIEWAGERP